MMEFELYDNEVHEEDMPEVTVGIDDPSFEGERCGICMEIVIDRGMLNCCQHWFCFECIDNWSTITNHCPLCQNEFQLITCIPVYDVIRSTSMAEQSICGDDDWCIEGKNSTLSFPSYYIDENAVTCLDEDECRIRNGLVATQEDLTLDTSIACDSCDMWYHAFCVGFDPECASVDSWICPRCSGATTVKRSELKFPGNERHSHKENHDSQCLVGTFSGNVSISIADAGETAVVVSLIDGEQVVEDPKEKPPSAVELIMGIAESDTLANSEETTEVKNMTSQSNAEEQELHISIFDEKSLSLSQDFLGFKSNAEDEEKGLLISFDGPEVPSAKLQDFMAPSSSCPDHELSVGPTVSGNDRMAIQFGGDEQHTANILADENDSDAAGEMVSWTTAGVKRKRADFSVHGLDDKQVNIVKAYEEEEEGNAAKDTPKTPLVSQAKDLSLGLKKPRCSFVKSSNENLGNEAEKKIVTTDIMSIVQGTELRVTNESMSGKSPDKILRGRGNAAGLRLRKIMKRPKEDEGSYVLVQELRKEIRDVSGNRSMEDAGKCILDPKLLAAFRAVVKNPASGPAGEMPRSILKGKKSMSKKRNARENLTKKIYATSTGKRRNLWVRDFEVEFWRNRCHRTAKADKIDTLKSVLDLLKMNPETSRSLQNSEDRSSILSRLYIADASVFPRKDDIKPLSVIKTSHASGDNEALTSAQPISDSHADRTEKKIQVPSISRSSSVCNGSVDASIGTPFASNNGQLSRQFKKSSPVSLIEAGVVSQQPVVDGSKDKWSDKRKWAQEFLARRKASENKSSVNSQQDDNAEFKRKYPLLGQLPSDMWPNVAPSRQTKIPAAIRQAQLYRLAEQLLRISNLPSIHRTAATELAVADAINIEKGFADRSKTKVVYMNLCSQEIRRRSQNNAAESNVHRLIIPPASREPSISGESCDPDVESMLRAAGLSSDSPPSSPSKEAAYLNVGHSSAKASVAGPDDIFDMDSHPELDIYGDFEYNLEDEDYIGSTAINISNSHAEEESKMKLVFSTLNMEKAGDDDDDDEDCGGVNTKMGVSSLCSHREVSLDGCCATNRVESLPSSTSVEESVGEPTDAECEELYGPDKEPQTKGLPSLFSTEQAYPLNVHLHKEVQVATSDREARVSFASSSGNNVPSPCHSQSGENAKKEKPKETDVDKKADNSHSVFMKVEAYVKEHIRPLCKSGVITVQQYRWAVGKTTDKVMRYHSKAKDADFLIKGGEKVKKLAEQYVEAAKLKED